MCADSLESLLLHPEKKEFPKFFAATEIPKCFAVKWEMGGWRESNAKSRSIEFGCGLLRCFALRALDFPRERERESEKMHHHTHTQDLFCIYTLI